MDGPMSGSGIMVLLHDPMVLPQMRDLAYAISPGSHTLLPVSHTEVRVNHHSNLRFCNENHGILHFFVIGICDMATSLVVVNKLSERLLTDRYAFWRYSQFTQLTLVFGWVFFTDR